VLRTTYLNWIPAFAGMTVKSSLQTEQIGALTGESNTMQETSP